MVVLVHGVVVHPMVPECSKSNWINLSPAIKILETLHQMKRKLEYSAEKNLENGLGRFLAGCKESQVYSLPFGQAVATCSIY